MVFIDEKMIFHEKNKIETHFLISSTRMAEIKKTNDAKFG